MRQVETKKKEEKEEEQDEEEKERQNKNRKIERNMETGKGSAWPHSPLFKRVSCASQRSLSSSHIYAMQVCQRMLTATLHVRARLQASFFFRGARRRGRASAKSLKSWRTMAHSSTSVGEATAVDDGSTRKADFAGNDAHRAILPSISEMPKRLDRNNIEQSPPMTKATVAMKPRM